MIHINVDEGTQCWLNKLRKEIMLENCENIPLSKIIYISLIELRRNNKDEEIKRKLVHYKRLGRVGMKGVLTELQRDD